MSSRRTARKNAFIALYQGDVTERPVEDMLSRWRTYRGEVDPYMARLVRGVAGHEEELDARIGDAAVGWTVERMSAIDRNIMRLALFEMLHVEDVPPEVAVKEGMELAKGFSSEEAPQFVGGVLRGARPDVPGDAAPEDGLPEDVVPEDGVPGRSESHEERRASIG